VAEAKIRRKPMETKKAVPLVMGALIALFILGCASYGQLGYIEPGPQEKVSISTLVDHWQDYDVYVQPLDSALMFAFKTPERRIAPASYWERVENKKELIKIVNNIASQPTVGMYWPRLWKILGPKDDLYGYMFTAWNHVDMTKVNKNTLFVYDFPPPPFQSFGRGVIGGTHEQ
jgi:hypothetical protein